MPIVAILPAVAAIGVAAVDVAAVGLTAITAFEITAAVGATIGAIGAVTKNKTLSMIGLGIGAIGGIGALATSAGLFGAEAAGGSSLFGSGSSATQEVGGTWGGDFSPQISAPGSAAASGGVESGVWDAASGAGMSVSAAESSPSIINQLANAESPAEASAPDVFTGITNSQNVTPPSGAANAVAPTGSDTTTASVLNPGQTGSTTGVEQGAWSTPTQTAAATGGEQGTWAPTQGVPAAPKIDPATGLPVDKGMFDNLLSYVDKHPALAIGAVQAGGSLLSGATSTLTPAQVAALNAQAANNQAQANLTSTQATNLGQPKAVASLQPVTGQPAPLVPGGLINQPRVNVTGVPA